MKRLIALVLSAMMLFSTIPTSVFVFAASDEASSKNITDSNTICQAISLDGELDCVNGELKVLFEIPDGFADINGFQLQITMPDGFSVDSITSPLTDSDWLLYSKIADTSLVIMECGDNFVSLEKLTTPDENGKYHILTLAVSVDGEVSAGEKTASILLQDITTDDEPNENTVPTNATFNYDGEHDWKLDKENEVKYCARECGVDVVPVYVITFMGKNDKVLYDAALDIVGGFGQLSDADISAAVVAAPYLYGYEFTGWNREFSTETLFSGSTTIEATYNRKTATYNTILTDSNDEIIETQKVQFDQRFTVTDENAKSFLVDDQVVGGEGSLVLYGCGSEMTIKASTETAPQEVSVAILKTVAEPLNGKNVLRVFVHVYNPIDAEISKLGVMFAPGNAYESDELFTMEHLSKYATLDAELPTYDVLASINGIKSGVSRVVRAYAVVDGLNILYSGRVAQYDFN